MGQTSFRDEVSHPLIRCNGLRQLTDSAGPRGLGVSSWHCPPRMSWDFLGEREWIHPSLKIAGIVLVQTLYSRASCYKWGAKHCASQTKEKNIESERAFVCFENPQSTKIIQNQHQNETSMTVKQFSYKISPFWYLFLRPWPRPVAFPLPPRHGLAGDGWGSGPSSSCVQGE